MMNLNKIHFHDSQIIRVVEYLETGELLIDVDYPIDWQNDIFEHKIIVFRNVLNYEVHEGPFEGRPTILQVQQVGRKEERSLLRIETNAGFRQLLCTEVELQNPSGLD